MNWWNKVFKPHQDNFLQLLTEQAEYAVKGLDSLQTYTGGGNGESAQAVAKFEKEADEVRRVLIDELNRTFITPIDREDIFALSRAVDDILDYAYSTVDEMRVLHVEPNPYLHQMVSLLREAADEVLMAMQQLKAHPHVASDHAVRAKALENRVEKVYREAIGALFQGTADSQHIMEMLKLRELYRHLSNAADRGDEAANIISDIVVKMT